MAIAASFAAIRFPPERTGRDFRLIATQHRVNASHFPAEREAFPSEMTPKETSDTADERFDDSTSSLAFSRFPAIRRSSAGSSKTFPTSMLHLRQASPRRQRSHE